MSSESDDDLFVCPICGEEAMERRPIVEEKTKYYKPTKVCTVPDENVKYIHMIDPI